MVSKKRYSSTGWSQKSPTRGDQRNLIKKKCGNKCFLRPKDNGFPICTSNCAFDCSGLKAAKNRARQYNYTSIENKAKSIELSFGCKLDKKYSTMKSAPRKSASKKSRSKSNRKPCKSNQVRNQSTHRCRNKSAKSTRKSPIRKSRTRKSLNKSRVRKSTKKSRSKPTMKSDPRKSASKKSRSKSNRKPCKSNQIRNQSTHRCRNKSAKSPRKSSTRKSRVRKSRNKSRVRKSTRKSRSKPIKKSFQYMRPYEKAIQFNLKYYSKHHAGKINQVVYSYLKKTNQTYELTVDLLDVASGIALNEYGKKTVTMRDIKLAKSVDSLLEKNFP